MNKNGVVGIFVFVIVGGIFVVLFLQPVTETVNLDMSRTHGTVSTAMGSPILGDPTAQITIIEFGDYQCHQCYKWFHDTKPAIIRDYVDTGKANFIFIDSAFLGSGSSKAAQASYCAEDQKMYWEYHDLLYNLQESKIDGERTNPEKLKSFASSLDLDMELFESCLDSEKYYKRVHYNVKQAQENGIKDTPGFFIIGHDEQKQINGPQPFSIFKQVMDTMI
ncbi:MAG: DsbA family protein [Nitrosopumilus sp.]